AIMGWRMCQKESGVNGWFHFRPVTSSSAHKHQMSSSIKSQIPVDIMLEILDNLDKSDIATMCRLNKLCCALAQPVLFRDIRFQFSDKSEFGLLRNHAR